MTSSNGPNCDVSSLFQDLMSLDDARQLRDVIKRSYLINSDVCMFQDLMSLDDARQLRDVIKRSYLINSDVSSMFQDLMQQHFVTSSLRHNSYILILTPPCFRT